MSIRITSHRFSFLVAAICLGLLAGPVGCRSDGRVPAERLSGVSVRLPIHESIEVDADSIERFYEKREVMIPMRDGVSLHTSIYLPRDASQMWPFMLKRTPYACGPYGEDRFPTRLGPDPVYPRTGYIFVEQDVRGRFMSEGTFVDMRPHALTGESVSINEATDTWDTIDWLVRNVPRNNGRVGMTGISYPGFYAAAGMIDAHPALRAVSPQAPIADWWYDDFHHHGAFFMPHAFWFLAVFGQERSGPTTEWPERGFEVDATDGYSFFLDEVGTTRALDDNYLNGSIAFWNELVAHPNRDEFWTSRDILPHLHNVAPAVLTVGGWFDAEDLYGPLSIYRTVEANNPNVENSLVMGPWSHGGWHRTKGDELGAVNFGVPTSARFLAEIERPFFEHHLKGGPEPNIPEAMIFETGRNQWRAFPAWPPQEREPRVFMLRPDGRLVDKNRRSDSASADYVSFTSDPADPVPYTEEESLRMTKQYMTDDQRFAAARDDVLTFQTDTLDRAITIAGPIDVELTVSTTAMDADWVVKLIDVYPEDVSATPELPGEEAPGGFQMMVRSEVLRGRFRNDPSSPEPFEPGEPTTLTVHLQDVLHTFRPGHRLMIHVQSTWFPLVDRNPQSWVDNIFLAEPDDYVRAEHRVHTSESRPSVLRFDVLPAFNSNR